MPTLKANIGGVWTPISSGGGTGAEEVEVGASEPTASTIELWVDTDDPGQSFPNMPRGFVAYGAAPPAVDQSVATTATDITGVTATFTADPSRRYRTTLVIPTLLQNAAQGLVTAYITDGAGVELRRIVLGPVDAGFRDSVNLTLVESGLSGSVTRKAQAFTSASTVMVANTSNKQATILVEDIGAAGQSGGGVWTEYLPKGIVAWRTASASTFQTTSATAVPITVTTGQAPSIQAALDPNRLYRAMFKTVFAQTALTDRFYFEMFVDGIVSRILLGPDYANAASVNHYREGSTIFKPADSALHTYDMRARIGSGITLLTNGISVLAPMDFYIEDLGRAV